jgi:hypothetical protein
VCHLSLVCVSPSARSWAAIALGPGTPKVNQICAMRRKCDRRLGLSLSPANCIQSASRRRHSKACFRICSGSDIARLVEAPTDHRCTASPVLSVVYATERNFRKFPLQMLTARKQKNPRLRPGSNIYQHGAGQDCARHTRRRAEAGEHHRQRV